MEGLEPPRLAAPDPKSGAATNYATSGYLVLRPFPARKGRIWEKGAQIYSIYWQLKQGRKLKMKGRAIYFFKSFEICK
jgi:hypothetical protein